MFGLIFGVLMLIAGIACSFIFRTSDDKPNWFLTVVGVIVAAIVIVASCFTSVAAGHTGVVTSFGRVEEYTLDSGVHFIAPWKTVIEMDNRVQKKTVELSCFSSDIQEVKVTYTINYQINKATAQELYKTVGENYYDTVIIPNINECVKMSVSQYTAEELVNERSEMATLCESFLVEQLNARNIELVSTSVENLDFTDAFTNAVEAKQVAQQNKLKAITEQEQKTAEEQAAADRALITANANAEVARINAEAEAEVARIQADADRYTGEQKAEANKAISASLTEDIIQYYYILQWDGVLPGTYVGSDDVNTIVGMP